MKSVDTSSASASFDTVQSGWGPVNVSSSSYVMADLLRW
jgi:hypothetical protein